MMFQYCRCSGIPMVCCGCYGDVPVMFQPFLSYSNFGVRSISIKHGMQVDVGVVNTPVKSRIE